MGGVGDGIINPRKVFWDQCGAATACFVILGWLEGIGLIDGTRAGGVGGESARRQRRCAFLGPKYTIDLADYDLYSITTFHKLICYLLKINHAFCDEYH